MEKRLEGLSALVTGASSGIGEATARALAAEGAMVTLAARRLERLTNIAKEIVAGGGEALAAETDVTVKEQAKAAVDQTVEATGRLDIVINNAGLMLLGPSVEATTEDWDRMLSLNLAGNLYVAHAAMPHLLKAAEEGPREVADLVNVSSIAGRQIHPGAAVYNLTKHGLGAFSESVRQEVAERHVRVGLIEPGLVTTEIHTHLSPGPRKRAEERYEYTECLQAEDIAESIVYMVTRRRRVAINELLVRPTESTF